MTNSSGYFNHGKALYKQGMLKEAAEAYLNSIEIDASNTEAYTRLGTVLTELKTTYSHQPNQPRTEFKSQSKTYNLCNIFSYDERRYAKQTVYLSDFKISPPVFSIVSPWGPIANNKRSYPLFFNPTNVIIQKNSYQFTIFGEDGCNIPTSYLPAIPFTRENPFVSKDRSFGLFSTHSPSLLVNEPCVIIDSCLQCFAHFMHDYLPYILLAHTHPQTNTCKIILPQINRNEERFLKHLNIPREKIITWADLTAGMDSKTSVKISNAYIPIHLPLPAVIEVVRNAFKCSPDRYSSEHGRKLFISRKPSPNTQPRIENEKELSIALEKIGFETVVPDRLPIDEQIRVFSDARIIIGTAGAGMFSQVWAPKGAAIIVIMNEENYKYAVRETAGYQQVSACLGHIYFRLIYKSLLDTREGTPGATEVIYNSPEGEKRMHVSAVPYRCDPQEVVRLAEFILSQQIRMITA